MKSEVDSKVKMEEFLQNVPGMESVQSLNFQAKDLEEEIELVKF